MIKAGALAGAGAIGIKAGALAGAGAIGIKAGAGALLFLSNNTHRFAHVI